MGNKPSHASMKFGCSSGYEHWTVPSPLPPRGYSSHTYFVFDFFVSFIFFLGRGFTPVRSFLRNNSILIPLLFNQLFFLRNPARAPVFEPRPHGVGDPFPSRVRHTALISSDRSGTSQRVRRRYSAAGTRNLSRFRPCTCSLITKRNVQVRRVSRR